MLLPAHRLSLFALLLGLPVLAADDLKTEAVQKAVKDYADKAGNEKLKPVTDLGEVVNVADVKAGKGLTYTPATDDTKAAFSWTYPVKKAPSDEQKPLVEKALRGLLADAIADQKEALKLSGDALTKATDLAKKAKVTAGKAPDSSPGGAPGVIPEDVVGELALKDLTPQIVGDEVRAYFKANDKVLEPFDKVVFTDLIRRAADLYYVPENNKPYFTWGYGTKKEAALEKADAEKLQGVLRDALAAALAAEKDKAKKLQPADLKAVQAAAKEAKVEAKPYSRLPELTRDTWVSWIKAYLAKYPTAFDGIKEVVDVESVNPPEHLTYYPDTLKLAWEYEVKRGRPVPPTADEQVANTLRQVLNAAVDAAEGSAKYPAGDREALGRIIAAGAYTRFEKVDLRREDVTEEKVRAILREYFIGNLRAPRVLRDVGVSAENEEDRKYLFENVSYTPDPIAFSLKYRLIDQAAPLTDDVRAAQQDRLRQVLYDAVRTGGGRPDLKVSQADFQGHFGPAIREAKTEPAKDFTLADMDVNVARQMVDAYVSSKAATAGTVLDKLSGLVDATALKRTVLDFDPKAVSFKWELPIPADRNKPLTEDEKKTVVGAVKDLLAKAFTDTPLSNRKLVKKDLNQVVEAIDKAKITVLDADASKKAREELAKRLEEERKERVREAREQLREERLTRLEDAVDELRRLVGEGGTAEQKYVLRCLEQYTPGCCGPTRRVVPVYVPVK